MATTILSQAGNALSTSPITTPTSSEMSSLPIFDHISDNKPDTKTNELPKKKSSRRANTAERRATHNAVERQRRETLNGRFLDLAALLPTLSQIRRPSKSAIVTSSISFIHAARHHRLLAARELRMMTMEADVLKREVNEWRARAGVRPVEERERSEGWNVVISGEMEMLDMPLPSVASNGNWGLDDDLLEDDDDLPPPSAVPATPTVEDAQRFAQQMSLHHPHPAAPAPMIVSPTAFEHPAATFEHLHLLQQQQQQQQSLLAQSDASAWYTGSPDASAFLTPPSSAHGHSSPLGGSSPLRPSSSSSASSHSLPEITIAPSIIGGPPSLFGASSPAEQQQLDLELEEVAAGSDSGSIGHGSSLGHGHGASSPSSSASSCASSIAPSTFGQAHALALQHQQAVAAYELAALTANPTAYANPLPHHPMAHPILHSQWKDPLPLQMSVQVGGYMM